MAAGTRVEEHTTTPEERKERLKELEGIIQRGKEVFLKVGQALEDIPASRTFTTPSTRPSRPTARRPSPGGRCGEYTVTLRGRAWTIF